MNTRMAPSLYGTLVGFPVLLSLTIQNAYWMGPLLSDMASAILSFAAANSMVAIHVTRGCSNLFALFASMELHFAHR